MPHLRFRALETQHVQSLSQSLLAPLQPLMACPNEDFTFEKVASDFYFSGLPTSAYPFVEVLWFDRGQEKQDLIAKIITEQVRHLRPDTQDIAVIFHALTPARYYDNGQHY